MEVMEIPVMSRISGLEAEITRLQNPSFVSRLFNISGIEEISINYSFWTWGALILAFLATFSGMMGKLVIFRFWKSRSVIPQHFLRPILDEDDCDEEDDICSSSSSDDDEDEAIFPFENHKPVDEDFRVMGSGNYDEDEGKISRPKLRRRRSSCEDGFSWSDFANGKSVVKLWDGLGLGLKLEDSSRGCISMWDLNRDQLISSFSGRWCRSPVVSRASPDVIVTAGLEDSRNVALRVWDARIGRQTPVVFAEWQPSRRGIVGVNSGGVEKVYVRDDGSSLAVRDMRNVGLPLEGPTESYGETWWDADAVMVSDGDCDGCFDESPANLGGSVASRCRDAVKSYLF